MSRVSDAMKRAGHVEDEHATIKAEDLRFAPNEDAAAPEPGPVAPAVDPVVIPAYDSLYRPMAMVPRDRAGAPMEPARVVEGSDDVRIFDIMRVLFRRRWMIAATVVVCLAAAAVYNHIATPLYEARARLLLEPGSADPVPFRTASEDQGRLDYFVTQLEVLRSRGLAQKTLEQLKMLSKDPAKQAGQINSLLGGLTVAPVTSSMGGTRVITVTVRSGDPKLAAQLANGVARTYVDQNLESRRQGSRDAAEWLGQRLAELRTELAQSESALQQYREQKDAVSLDSQQNIVVQKLAQLNTSVTSARTERVQKQAVYEQLQAIRAAGEPLDTFTPIQTNGFIQGLKADLANLQREKRQLSEQLGELHPEMIRVNTAIANAERRLNEEMAKVVDGVQNEYRAAKANEQGLSEALEEQKQAVLKLNHQAIAYGQLQRDEASTQQMFETVRQRVKETEISGELQSNNAKILDAAEVPHGPIWPRKQLNLIIALLGGGFLAFGLAFALENLNPHIAKPTDIVDALGLPLLGVTPRIRGLKARNANLGTLSAPYQEALRSVRTRIFLSPVAAAAKSMAVTSTHPGEGKTMVASNLAVSMAMAGRRVLLVDADLRRPQVHRVFSVSKAPGLSDVISGTAKPSDALRETPTTGLFMLPAGGDVANPTDLLDSDRLQHLIQGFSQVFDVIVLDCPPVLAVADASIIAHAASSVLFVVGSGITTREAAQVAVERLLAVQANMVGVVLNNAKVDPRSEYGYSAYLSDTVQQPGAGSKTVAEHA